MIALGLALLAAAAVPQAATPAAAPKSYDPIEADWRAIPDDELMLIDLADGHRVAVRLAAAYAPAHVANIRRLARARWWDGESIYRVQENWVAQWGDPTEQKPLPPGITDHPPAEFEIAEFAPAQRMAKADGYSTASGITADGWPVATDDTAAWLTHCYAMVGVARDAAPSTGSGSELFTPIGQSARRLDRNYTVVGRIVAGMAYVSALPRSDATMGVYATAAERTGIARVRLASDLPAAERPHFQYRAADNIRFAAAIAHREHPDAPTVPTGANVCDVLPAVRPTP
ncbi:peptidylprolyl isomerase [Sphingomonas oligophenolica]|uniref:peptidylprolyl isomerase n=1 Tax=Sphingomonas oligophenolica TaxID=301154 RepID=A0A502CE10_9SPHN|nr:peptidylprolyl isomerase [Sphingomonas oligophenolica]TPG10026.1 peptidylprolyl isomerase [Sphingomonas oligophenolica]